MLDKDKIRQLRVAFEASSQGSWEVCLGSGSNVCTSLVNVPLDDFMQSEVVADFLPDWVLKGNCGPKDHLPNMEFVRLAHEMMPEILETAVKLEVVAEKLRMARVLLFVANKLELSEQQQYVHELMSKEGE